MAFLGEGFKFKSKTANKTTILQTGYVISNIWSVYC
jgi:hypothetical protein